MTEEEFDIKKNMRVIIPLFFIGLIVASVFLTKIYVEKETEKVLIGKLDKAFEQCRQSCGFREPAFIDVSQGTANCRCLEFSNNDNSSNNNIV